MNALFAALFIALTCVGSAQAVEYFMTTRPRRKALKQIRAGQRWKSKSIDVVWVVGDWSPYLGAVYMHIDRTPTIGMIFPAEFVVKFFQRVELPA